MIMRKVVDARFILFRRSDFKMEKYIHVTFITAQTILESAEMHILNFRIQIQYLMGCSASKKSIQYRTQHVLVQQGYQGDLITCEAKFHQSAVIESKEVMLQQVIPSSGETDQQPIPSSPGFLGVQTPTFCSQMGGLKILPHIKPALIKQNESYNHIEQKRSKSVSFKLDKSNRSTKPNYALRKKFNIDDLFL